MISKLKNVSRAWELTLRGFLGKIRNTSWSLRSRFLCQVTTSLFATSGGQSFFQTPLSEGPRLHLGRLNGILSISLRNPPTRWSCSSSLQEKHVKKIIMIIIKHKTSLRADFSLTSPIIPPFLFLSIAYPALPQHLPQAVGVGFFSSLPSSSFTLSSSFSSFASLLPLHFLFPLRCFPSQLLLFILIFLRFTPDYSWCPSISFPLLPFPFPSPPFSSYLYPLQIYIILPTLKYTIGQTTWCVGFPHGHGSAHRLYKRRIDLTRGLVELVGVFLHQKLGFPQTCSLNRGGASIKRILISNGPQKV